jgi:phosphate transport system protein
VPHLEQTLQQDIDRISGRFSEMLALAVRALQDCVQALREQNRQLAYSVILRDQRIDELEKELDRLSLEFIVRQQPVARHLRFAYAAIKISSKLERVGDYAESIARQILTVCSMDLDFSKELVEPIAAHAIPMVRDAMTAFITQDVELAKKTMEREDTVDRLRHDLSRKLIGLHTAAHLPLEALTPVQNILNRLERVADQAKSICQDVMYLCTGEYVKHLGSEVFRVLFVDADNASLGPMAETIGSGLNQPHFLFSSAGVERTSIDPATVAFLQAKGEDIHRLASRALDQIPNRDHYQVVIALCREGTRAFPPAPTKVVCLDWSDELNGDSDGTAERGQERLERRYQYLAAHLKDLVEAVLSDKPTSDSEREQ